MDERGEEKATEMSEAHTCIALGAGVGILGGVSAALTGAVCPLCIFIAPGLIGYGMVKKWQAKGNDCLETKAPDESSCK